MPRGKRGIGAGRTCEEAARAWDWRQIAREAGSKAREASLAAARPGGGGRKPWVGAFPRGIRRSRMVETEKPDFGGTWSGGSGLELGEKRGTGHGVRGDPL